MIPMSRFLRQASTFPSHRIVQVESRKSVEIDSNLLFGNEGFSIFPEVEARGLAFIQMRNRKAIISAGAFVGVVPITPNIHLDIRPKLPIQNLDRVLMISARRLISLKDAGRKYDEENSLTNPVLMFIADNITRTIQHARKLGFLKQYSNITETGNTLRGRILVRPTVINQRVRARPTTVSVSKFYQTVDNPANRLIKDALLRAISALSIAGEVASPSLKSLSEALNLLPRGIGNLMPSDTQERVLSQLRIPQTHSFYEDAIRYALLIVRRKGLSLSASEGSHLLDGFIINFETMFEDYTRNALRLGLGDEYSVKDGNGAARKPLFDNKQDPPAQPDIVVTNGARTLVIEVKYKEKPDRTDINQAITYALCYRTTRVVLLHLSPSDQTCGMRLIGKIQGTELYGYRFYLGSESLEEQERRFANEVSQLFEEL